MAWPMGVVVPYARHMSHGLREWALKRVMEAMREPRARPSKVSVGGCQYRVLTPGFCYLRNSRWKVMAIKSTMKFEPVATLNAIPVSNPGQYQFGIKPRIKPPGRPKCGGVIIPREIGSHR